jgi:hypothetical protein
LVPGVLMILQKARKLRPSAVQTRLYGSLRQLFNGRDFADAQAFHVAEHENGAEFD